MDVILIPRNLLRTGLAIVLAVDEAYVCLLEKSTAKAAVI